jgi:hypothetical protein
VRARRRRHDASSLQQTGVPRQETASLLRTGRRDARRRRGGCPCGEAEDDGVIQTFVTTSDLPTRSCVAAAGRCGDHVALRLLAWWPELRPGGRWPATWRRRKSRHTGPTPARPTRAARGRSCRGCGPAVGSFSAAIARSANVHVQSRQTPPAMSCSSPRCKAAGSLGSNGCGRQGWRIERYTIDCCVVPRSANVNLRGAQRGMAEQCLDDVHRPSPVDELHGDHVPARVRGGPVGEGSRSGRTNGALVALVGRARLANFRTSPFWQGGLSRESRALRAARQRCAVGS